MQSWILENSRIFDRGNINFIKKWWIDIDKVNLFLILAIIVFGLVITATGSPAIAKRIGVEKFLFLKKQLIFAALALLIMMTISFFDEITIKIFAVFGFIGAFALLILVLITGVEAKGSVRWLNLGGFSLQPSELAKTFFIVFNSYILWKFHDKDWRIKYLCSTASFLLIGFLLYSQPDYGMTLVLSLIWLSQLFVYGLNLSIVIISIIAVLALLVYSYFTLPHVQDRIMRFLDPTIENYQVERSLDAFANGGIFGKGIGNGVVKNFIPDAHTDFVFAVIAEEFGIIACVVVILAFFYLIKRIVGRLMAEENLFIFLSLFGLMMQFFLQVAVNISVSLALFPTKGMTLPFISYGGSSMFSMAICFGLILALTKKKYNQNIDYGNLKMI